MTGRAEVRLAGRDAVFVARECRVAAPFVHATGRWRRHLAQGESWSAPRSYTWPAREIREIRWSVEQVSP